MRQFGYGDECSHLVHFPNGQWSAYRPLSLFLSFLKRNSAYFPLNISWNILLIPAHPNDEHVEIKCALTWAEEWQVPIGWWRITLLRWVFFTRHQWALLPAHKESRARGCAQCESSAQRHRCPLLSASWQHLVECNLRRSRNVPA